MNATSCCALTRRQRQRTYNVYVTAYEERAYATRETYAGECGDENGRRGHKWEQ